jgi:hypothetical protein
VEDKQSEGQWDGRRLRVMPFNGGNGGAHDDGGGGRRRLGLGLSSLPSLE